MRTEYFIVMVILVAVLIQLINLNPISSVIINYNGSCFNFTEDKVELIYVYSRDSPCWITEYDHYFPGELGGAG